MMFSKAFLKNKRVSPTGFRYRGIRGSRLEYLTDAVFGFSITLLVISSEVPKTYLELQTSLYGFSGFIFCTLFLIGLWNNHSNFFLRYGMQDTLTKTLNSLFLFILLFLVYPLKYLFSLLGTLLYVQFKQASGDQSEALKIAISELSKSALTFQEWAEIMVLFGVGLFLVYFLLFLFHLNAWSKRVELELNDVERFETISHLHAYAILMGIAVTSLLVVAFFGGGWASIAGAVYALVPILLLLHQRIRKGIFKKRFKVRKKPAATAIGAK